MLLCRFGSFLSSFVTLPAADQAGQLNSIASRIEDVQLVCSVTAKVDPNVNSDKARHPA